MPQRNKCRFASRVLKIKIKYGLSVDQAEASTLEAVLSACESVELIFYPVNSFNFDEEVPLVTRTRVR